MRARPFFTFTLTALAALLTTTRALADRVAVLPFSSARPGAAHVIEAEAATKGATLRLEHTFPSEAELASGRAAVKDRHADTSEEYRAFGKEARSDWTVRGVVDAHENGYRLELETCQIRSGRVEYLARDISPASAEAQVREMLALLLRPEGIGTGEVPWAEASRVDHRAATPGPPLQPVQPPSQPPTAHRYAEGHPFALGVSTGLASAAARQ